MHAWPQGSIRTRCAVQGLPQSTELHKDIKQEPKEQAVGVGAGILVTAVASTGLVLGRDVPAARSRPAQEIGEQAASDLLEDLQTGSCVDEW